MLELLDTLVLYHLESLITFGNVLKTPTRFHRPVVIRASHIHADAEGDCNDYVESEASSLPSPGCHGIHVNEHLLSAVCV